MIAVLKHLDWSEVEVEAFAFGQEDLAVGSCLQLNCQQQSVTMGRSAVKGQLSYQETPEHEHHQICSELIQCTVLNTQVNFQLAEVLVV